MHKYLCINIAFSWYLAHSTHEANQSIEHFLQPYTALKSHSIHRSFLHITVTFCPRDYMLASGYNYGPLFYLVCRYHKPVFYRNGWTDRAGIWLRSRLHRLIGLIICSVLFCSLAVLDPRVGHTMDVLSPFIFVLCHSDWLFHGESCPRLDVVHPGRARPSSPTYYTACYQHVISKNQRHYRRGRVPWGGCAYARMFQLQE